MAQESGVLAASLRRGIAQLGSRKMYLFAMIIVPVFAVLFFNSLLGPGVSSQVPSAVVDLDHSALSRAVTRSLAAQELTDVTRHYNSYADAMDDVRSGKIFGFFVIPVDFERDVYAGRKPTLSYNANMTYFVPGTFDYKGFKTVAVNAAAGVLKSEATQLGLPQEVLPGLASPVDVRVNEIANPWTNYAYYLAPSFTWGVLELMILLVTVFSITTEIKNNTSRRWLRTGGDSILVSVVGKLLPQTIVFTVVGIGIMAYEFAFCHFPMNGSLPALLLAMFLCVVASQAMGLLFASVLPNPRLALSAVALIGILALSIAGISFPVPNMYGAMAILSYILPMRYLFLIYVNVGLNGAEVYYSRYLFVALVAFVPVGATMLWNLKRACKNPVYVP